MMKYQWHVIRQRFSYAYVYEWSEWSSGGYTFNFWKVACIMIYIILNSTLLDKNN